MTALQWHVHESVFHSLFRHMKDTPLGCVLKKYSKYFAYLCPCLYLTVNHFECKYSENVFSWWQIIWELTISKPCGQYYYLLYSNMLLNSNSVHDYLGTSLPRIRSHWCLSIALWDEHKTCMDEKRSVLCGKNIKGQKDFLTSDVTQLQVAALQLAGVLIKTNCYLIYLTCL